VHLNLSKTINVPMSCMHCEEADCVTVCPTGASYKRAEDGIVLIDPEKCMGCNYCAWACPYGARELDDRRRHDAQVHAVRGSHLRPGAARGRAQPACVLACPAHARHFGDFDDPARLVSRLVPKRAGASLLMDARATSPVNRYLPPRARRGRYRPGDARAANAEGSSAAIVNRLIEL
jgi:Fe-S-cluster-containing dehydrogenase component